MSEEKTDKTGLFPAVAGISSVFKPTSERIRNRILEAGASYLSGDNIANFISGPKELDELRDELERKLESVFQSLVIDTKNDHNTEGSAARIAKMYIHEIYRGRYYQQPPITTFPNADYDGLYLDGPIPIRSMCAHHNMAITGHCWIGLFPKQGDDGKVIGLSKFTRLVDWIARRPSIQEEMTVNIANAVSTITDTEDVAVLVKGEHHCMSHRGVCEHGVKFMTPIMRGRFVKSKMRDEFYKLVMLTTTVEN